MRKKARKESGKNRTKKGGMCLGCQRLDVKCRFIASLIVVS